MTEKTQELRSKLKEQFLNRLRQDFMKECMFALAFFTPDDLHNFIEDTINQHLKDSDNA